MTTCEMAKLDHIVIMVSDLDASLAFYRVLFPLLDVNESRDRVFTTSEGLSIDIRQAEALDRPYTRLSPGLNHIGFTVADRGAIQRIGRQMADAGYVNPEMQEYDDGIAIFLVDPDGMRVEVSTYE